MRRTLAPLLLALLVAARFAAAQVLPYGGDLGAHLQAGPERDATRPIPQSAPFTWTIGAARDGDGAILFWLRPSETKGIAQLMATRTDAAGRERSVVTVEGVVQPLTSIGGWPFWLGIQSIRGAGDGFLIVDRELSGTFGRFLGADLRPATGTFPIAAGQEPGPVSCDAARCAVATYVQNADSFQVNRIAFDGTVVDVSPPVTGRVRSIALKGDTTLLAFESIPEEGHAAFAVLTADHHLTEPVRLENAAGSASAAVFGDGFLVTWMDDRSIRAASVTTAGQATVTKTLASVPYNPDYFPFRSGLTASGDEWLMTIYMFGEAFIFEGNFYPNDYWGLRIDRNLQAVGKGPQPITPATTAPPRTRSSPFDGTRFLAGVAPTASGYVLPFTAVSFVLDPAYSWVAFVPKDRSGAPAAAARALTTVPTHQYTEGVATGANGSVITTSTTISDVEHGPTGYDTFLDRNGEPTAEIAGPRTRCWAAAGADYARVAGDESGPFSFERVDGRTGATRVTTPLRELSTWNQPCLVATAAGFAFAYRQLPASGGSEIDFRLRTLAADGRELADIRIDHVASSTIPNAVAGDGVVFLWWLLGDTHQIGFAVVDEHSGSITASGRLDAPGLDAVRAFGLRRELAFFCVSRGTLYATRIDADGRQPDGPAWRSVAPHASPYDRPAAAPLGSDWLVGTTTGYSTDGRPQQMLTRFRFGSDRTEHVLLPVGEILRELAPGVDGDGVLAVFEREIDARVTDWCSRRGTMLSTIAIHSTGELLAPARRRPSH